MYSSDIKKCARQIVKESSNQILAGTYEVPSLEEMKLFLEEQGYQIDKHILYQDNKSTILLEENGRKSARKWSHALNMRYFFMIDQIEKENMMIKYCPAEEMIADYMSKLLQGNKFKTFKDIIMGMWHPPW